MAPTLKQSALADTSALVVDGNTPTTVAGDDYGHLSSKALKRLCTERGLAVRGDHAALVGRLRAGKKTLYIDIDALESVRARVKTRRHK